MAKNMTSFNWAYYAQNVAALVSNSNVNLMPLVIEFRDQALRYLEQKEIASDLIHPLGHKDRHDLTNPDYGIVYFLLFSKTYTGTTLNALHLFRRCLHIIEQGKLSPIDRTQLPLEVQGMAGIVSIQNSVNAKNTRTRIKTELNIALYEIVKANPTEGFDKLMPRLEGDGIVTIWDNSTVNWKDENDCDHETRASTVKGWITKAKKLNK